MSHPIQSNFLRRTAAALAAASGLLFLAEANAQSISITLSGATGNQCTFQNMSVNPDGSLTVNCEAVAPPPAGQPGTFAFFSTATSVQGSQNVSISVLRSGGATGEYNVSYTTTGPGCGTAEATGTVNFPDAVQARNIVFAAGTNVGDTCTVTLTAVAPAGTTTTATTLGTNKVNTVTIIPAPAAGCPATPAGMNPWTFAGAGAHNFIMTASGITTSAALPLELLGTRTGGDLNVATSPMAFSPMNATIEVSITKCPGQINTDLTDYCNRKWVAPTTQSMRWFRKNYGTVVFDKASAQKNRICWAPQAEGTWYVNIRSTFAACPSGRTTCGFNWQWNAAY